jgi:hypothetical protein
LLVVYAEFFMSFMGVALFVTGDASTWLRVGFVCAKIVACQCLVPGMPVKDIGLGVRRTGNRCFLLHALDLDSMFHQNGGSGLFYFLFFFVQKNEETHMTIMNGIKSLKISNADIRKGCIGITREICSR